MKVHVPNTAVGAESRLPSAKETAVRPGRDDTSLQQDADMFKQALSEETTTERPAEGTRQQEVGSEPGATTTPQKKTGDNPQTSPTDMAARAAVAVQKKPEGSPQTSPDDMAARAAAAAQKKPGGSPQTSPADMAARAAAAVQKKPGGSPRTSPNDMAARAAATLQKKPGGSPRTSPNDMAARAAAALRKKPEGSPQTSPTDMAARAAAALQKKTEENPQAKPAGSPVQAANVPERGMEKVHRAGTETSAPIAADEKETAPTQTDAEGKVEGGGQDLQQLAAMQMTQSRMATLERTGTVATPTISPRLVADVAQRILVSAGEHGQDKAVRIQIKDTVLQDTEVVISRQKGELVVLFETGAPADNALLNHCRDSIRTSLENALDGPVRVGVSAEQADTDPRDQHERRSRGLYVPEDDT